jgi:hypothetical protein
LGPELGVSDEGKDMRGRRVFDHKVLRKTFGSARDE